MDRQRRQRQAEERRRSRARAALARPRRRSSQTASTSDREDREVVGGEREAGGDPPEHEVAALAAAQRPHAVEQRDRAEQRQQRVGPRLLRVPEQHRVDRDQGRRHQPGAAPAQLERRAGRRPGPSPPRPAAESERRPNSPVPGQLGPEPGQRVVERRRRLAEADRVHRVAEAAAEDAAGGDDLVVVVGLDAEGGEAQDARRAAVSPATIQKARERARAASRSDCAYAAGPPRPRVAASIAARRGLRRAPWRPRRRRRTRGRRARARGSRRRRPRCAPARSPA